MMLNKHSIDTLKILDHLGKHPRWGARNRAIQCLREFIRLKDLAKLKIGDVVDATGEPQTKIVSSIDQREFILPPLAIQELRRYLKLEFGMAPPLDCDIPLSLRNKYLFATAKSLHHSPNTLGQLCSHLSASVRQEFKFND